MLCVWRVSGEQLAEVPFMACRSVWSLKSHLQALHGFPVCIQRLLHAGNILENSAELNAPADIQLVLLHATSIAQVRRMSIELVQSAEKNRLEVVRLLLGAGASVDWKDVHGYTALMRSSALGHVEVVRLLLETGADRNARGTFPQWGRHQDQLEYLRESIYQARIYTSSCGETALLLASGNGHDSVVKLLLRAGADTNLTDKHGNTPLISASGRGHVDVVRRLLAAGASTDIVAHVSGKTALMCASDNGHLEVVHFLVGAGTDMDLKSKKQNTALM